jgi:archaemetzincin
MMRLAILITVLFGMIANAACGRQPDTPKNVATSTEGSATVARLRDQMAAVEKFSTPMQIKKGDWLDTRREQGETFDQYREAKPVRLIAERRTIYLQPIGEFTATQLKIAEDAAEYLRAFYGLDVTVNRRRDLGSVPANERRRVEYRNNLQIRTSYFLRDVLPMIIPEDAAAIVAFTNFDLYSEPTRAFVFGEAAIGERVAVWSFYQFVDAKTRRVNRDLLLRRTLKIAAHETGHALSMRHCTKYECLMAGTNNLDETDRRPADNCPECMAKVAWATGYDLAERYRRLAEFWKSRSFPEEHRSMREKMQAVADAR